MTIKDSQDFAAFLSGERHYQGLSLEALACETKTSPTTIFHCENPRNKKYGPSLGTLVRIADALGYEITLTKTKKENVR